MARGYATALILLVQTARARILGRIPVIKFRSPDCKSDERGPFLELRRE